MAISIAELLEALGTTGVLSPAEIQALESSPNNGAANPEEIVRELVRTVKLTRYQGAAIFQGKAQTLVLGNYLLMDKIGAGGMGQVFRARHRKMDRIVALKVLPKKSLASPDAVERFQREVKAAARLTHGNIVTAYDADESAGVHFLVMEYVEGTDLSSLVKSQGPLPVAQAVSCILQVARGLQHAHAEGVIHRDIKPSNLLLDKRGRVKILDMGLARFSEPANAASDSRDTATRSELTQTGSVMGTVDYMAPEQAIDTHQADHRADIYSLGCALYYVLTGGPPYTGETMMKRLVAHREAPIPSMRAARPDVPAELDQVFRRMVAKAVANRYQSMSEVIGALEGAARPQPTVPTAKTGGAKGRSRMPLLAGFAGAFVVLLAVLFFPRRSTDETARVEESATKQREALAPKVAEPSEQSTPSVPAATPATEAVLQKTLTESTTPAAEVKPAEVSAPSLAAAPAESPSASVAMPSPASTVEPAPPTVLAAAPAESNDAADEKPANAAAEGRLPVPDAAAREATLHVIKQIFASDYAAAKTAEGKADLLKKLLAQAENTNDDPAAKYVLLCEARDLAGETADMTTVDQAAETLAALYQVESLGMQVEVYQKLAGKSRPAAGNKALAESALALADRAIEADDLDAAEQLLKVASITAGKARAADLLKQAKARGEELADQKREAEAVRKAEEVIAKNADDAAANLTLGKYFCVSRDDWEQGLPHLAKGSDTTLKDLAAKSLPSPTDPAALSALGDAWWDAAEIRKGKEAEPLRAGARHWYSAALPELSGLVKTKVEKRLLELSASAGPKRNPAAKQKEAAETIELPLAANVTLKFRLIPAGTFQMGSPPTEPARADNEDLHEVTLSKPFYMAVTETTLSQWQTVMGGATGKTGEPTRPVTQVKWVACQDFIARLNQSTVGRAYQFRLPTEAEWEYACRAGTSAPYSFGVNNADQLSKHAWYKKNSEDMPHPVGQLLPNPWGLYDMHGNAWEWCSDWFQAPYGAAAQTDPRGPATGTERCIRGGSWGNQATVCRSATRGFKPFDYANPNIGFRLVCAPVGGFKTPPKAASQSTPRTSPKARTPGRMDLLSQINLERDVVSGNDWKFENGKLITPTEFEGGKGGHTARLVLPVMPPPEYALHMTVAPGTGTSFFVGLAMGGAQCGVYLDKGTTGMGMLDGLHPQKNSTTSKSVWDGNKPVDLVFEVRHSGITTKAGDQVIFAWTGEPQQLALFPAWKVPNPGSVFIGTGNNNGTMEISRIEIAPVDAPPKPGVKAEPRKAPGR